MKTSTNVKITLAVALLAGTCLSGCVADPYYGAPGYGPQAYGPQYGPQAYGPQYGPQYPQAYDPNYPPGYYQQGYQPAYYPPVVVAPAIGIGFGGGHRR